MQGIQEVQNRGISDPTKRTYKCPPNFFFKKITKETKKRHLHWRATGRLVLTQGLVYVRSHRLVKYLNCVNMQTKICRK